MTENRVILDESQSLAVRAAMAGSFHVINGGAGTGKTTIIKAIADEFLPGDCYLCAFAGKAAARLRDATGHPAHTIHKILECRTGGDGFRFQLKDLRGKTVVVDEASMVDSLLLWEIVKRHPDRLILVGDEAQLPPVGSGQPFHDIIRFYPDKVSTLEHSYRNAEAVYRAAQAIRSGSMPDMSERTENEFFEIRATGYADATHRKILDFVRSGDVDFAKDIILACRNGEGEEPLPATVESLNRDIKRMVNPSEKRLSSGDRVICTKNNPKLDVWNGTTGTVDGVDIDGAMWVSLDSPRLDKAETERTGTDSYDWNVIVPRDQVKDWELAYALTVHKSQGSQYRKVFFACLMRDAAVLLDRSMAYTAVTRATRECHVVGEPRALQDAVLRTPEKHTAFQEICGR